MTVAKALDMTASLRDTDIPESMMAEWLAAHDAVLWDRYLRHYGVSAPQEYLTQGEQGPEVSDEAEMLLPDRYGVQIYPLWLASQIDLNHGDYTRYNNDMLLYNNLLQNMLNDYTRERVYLRDEADEEPKPPAILF